MPPVLLLTVIDVDVAVLHLGAELRVGDVLAALLRQQLGMSRAPRGARGRPRSPTSGCPSVLVGRPPGPLPGPSPGRRSPLPRPLVGRRRRRELAHATMLGRGARPQGRRRAQRARTAAGEQRPRRIPRRQRIVAPMRRQCCRPACAEPAVATVTYHYGTQAAWLDPLSAERDPHSYDMCARHAERLRPPAGLGPRRSPGARRRRRSLNRRPAWPTTTVTAPGVRRRPDHVVRSRSWSATSWAASCWAPRVTSGRTTPTRRSG